MRVENRARLPEKGKSHEALAEHGATKAQTPQLNTALTLVVYRPRARAPHTMDNALVRHQRLTVQHADSGRDDRVGEKRQQTMLLWVVSFDHMWLRSSKRAMSADQSAVSATLTQAATLCCALTGERSPESPMSCSVCGGPAVQCARKIRLPLR